MGPCGKANKSFPSVEVIAGGLARRRYLNQRTKEELCSLIISPSVFSCPRSRYLLEIMVLCFVKVGESTRLADMHFPPAISVTYSTESAKVLVDRQTNTVVDA
jgi:hypothetical protein